MRGENENGKLGSKAKQSRGWKLAEGIAFGFGQFNWSIVLSGQPIPSQPNRPASLEGVRPDYKGIKSKHSPL